MPFNFASLNATIWTQAVSHQKENELIIKIFTNETPMEQINKIHFSSFIYQQQLNPSMFCQTEVDFVFQILIVFRNIKFIDIKCFLCFSIN